MTDTPLIAGVDVQYRENSARSAVVVFSGWESDGIVYQNAVDIAGIEDYQPGEFYRRELPCLLRVLETVPQQVQVIVIDGYVWLDQNSSPGLGARLYEALDRRIPIVGVAKTQFRGAPAVEVIRGQSRQPLFVTAVGLPAEEIAAHVQSMHGEHRIPTQLRRVDQLARSAGGADT